MRFIPLLALLIPAAFAAAQAPQAVPRSDGWVTELVIQRIEDQFLERPETARLSPQREGGWTTFTRTREMPADLAERAFTHDSFVVVDVSSSGHATGCRPLRPSAEPRLDALACRLLMRPEYFSAYLIPSDPAPAPARWAMGLRFETMEAAESARRRAAFSGILTPSIRADRPVAPAICSARRGWTWTRADSLESRYPRRVANWISVDGRGNATWNGAPTRRKDLERYLAITETMRPRPMLIVNRLPGASCAQVERMMEIVEAKLPCAPDLCLAASGPDRLRGASPPPAPPAPRPRR